MFVCPAVAGVPNVVCFPVVAELSDVADLVVFLASLLLLVFLRRLASVPCLVFIAVVGVLVANVSPGFCCCCYSLVFVGLLVHALSGMH